MNIDYIYDDGGRLAAGFKGNAGDCVTRAIAIAAGIDYLQVYKALSNGCRSQRMTRGKARKSSARDGVNVKRKWFRDYMETLGFKWVPTMGIGTGCRVHLRADELPPGRLVVSVSKHYTAVIDGVIHDTFNPADRGSTVYSPKSTDVPVGAVQLDNGFWAYRPERCVYGYWELAK